MNLRKGHIIRIDNSRYEVLDIREEFWYDTETESFKDEYVYYALSELDSDTILPTHSLRSFEDGKILFVDERQSPNDQVQVSEKDIEIIQ